MRRLAVADPGGGRRRVDRREVGLEGAPLRGAQPAAVVEGLVQLDHALARVVVSVGELLLEIGECVGAPRRQRGAAEPFVAQLGEQLALSVEARRREQRMRLAERAIVGARLEHPREPRLVRHRRAQLGEQRVLLLERLRDGDGVGVGVRCVGPRRRTSWPPPRATPRPPPPPPPRPRAAARAAPPA